MNTSSGRVECPIVKIIGADPSRSALIARSIPRRIQRCRSRPSRAGRDHSDTSTSRPRVHPRRTHSVSTFRECSPPLLHDRLESECLHRHLRLAHRADALSEAQNSTTVGRVHHVALVRKRIRETRPEFSQASRLAAPRGRRHHTVRRLFNIEQPSRHARPMLVFSLERQGPAWHSNATTPPNVSRASTNSWLM